MDNIFTLIVIVHNRQQYLNRLLDYYANFPYKIVIADSTRHAYTFKIQNAYIEYRYLPNTDLIEKLAIVLSDIKSEFVAICGVDDFVVPRSIKSCISFLQENEDYSCAMGNCFYYKIEEQNKKLTYFAIHHNNFLRDFNQPDSFERLKCFFDDYRTTYSAVHRKDVLFASFNAAKGKITNLFFNEYLAALYPVFYGKVIEFSALHQIREHIDVSDGSTTPNLDIIISNEKYRNEYYDYLQINAALFSKVNQFSDQDNYKQIDDILRNYANKLKLPEPSTKNKFKAFLIKSLNKYSIFRKTVLKYFYNRKSNNAISAITENKNDKVEMLKVENCILAHLNEI